MPNYSGIWTEQAMMQAVAAGTWSSVPGAPTIGTATSTGGTSASVAFTAPAFAGLPAVITGYTVTSSPGGITASGASSPVAITGLTEGTPYTFTVTATNASGTGTASAASNSVTPVQINYIEEMFSTWLYTGNSSANTLPNGINLSGKGGLIWLKQRNAAVNHGLFDTIRGGRYGLYSNTTNGNVDWGSNVVDFGTTGQTINNFGDYNDSGQTYVSWTFREQPKFFDVVTYTGDGAFTQLINHNLGSVPGAMFIKRTDSTSDWFVYHRSVGNDKRLLLNTTAASASSSFLQFETPTSTQFTVGFESGVNGVNNSGATYVAYLFAHNAGGFGLSGSDNVISCGSTTTSNEVVNLGWEPQFVLRKSNGTSPWQIFDTMRGLTTGGEGKALFANTSGAETDADGWVKINSTGFTMFNACIYIAIRRGPMKVPTTSTNVFAPFNTSVTSKPLLFNTNFPVDFALTRRSNGAGDQVATSRLQGGAYLDTTATTAEATAIPPYYTFDSNTSISSSYFNTGFGSVQSMLGFQRAPSYMDVVCYTGTGSARTVAHNLAAVPELMIVKCRSGADEWPVYSAPTGNNKNLTLNTTSAQTGGTSLYWNLTTPTATVFSLSDRGEVNSSGQTFVAYLFASAPGVSKVGSYTGTGTTQTINCGFAAGARFVLIKRTDSTGDWYYWDSARGIIAGNDPYLLLNSTAAEVTNTDYVDTAATGFEISSTAPAAINASGGTFIFLAIA